MSEHDDIRTLLPLASSGDISADESRRLNDHLARCEACRRESDDYGSLADALRAVPTPQPRPELIAQVRGLAEARLGRRAWRESAGILAPLVAASWAAALATWPLVKAAAAWALMGWRLPVGEFGTALGAYSILGLPLACAAALAVGMRARVYGRMK